jgi:hypothetical protein
MNLASISPVKSALREYDYALLWAGALLLGTGLVMVYSASIAIAEQSRFTSNQPTYFLVRHLIFVAIGTLVGLELPLERLWLGIGSGEAAKPEKREQTRLDTGCGHDRGADQPALARRPIDQRGHPADRAGRRRGLLDVLPAPRA